MRISFETAYFCSQISSRQSLKPIWFSNSCTNYAVSKCLDSRGRGLNLSFCLYSDFRMSLENGFGKCSLLVLSANKGTENRATKNVQRVARFTSHIKPVLQQIRLLTGLDMGGKTCNIAIQIVLQQCCKTNCTFFVAVFPCLN